LRKKKTENVHVFACLPKKNMLKKYDL